MTIFITYNISCMVRFGQGGGGGNIPSGLNMNKTQMLLTQGDHVNSEGWLFWRQCNLGLDGKLLWYVETSVTVSCVTLQSWQVSSDLGTVCQVCSYIREAEDVLKYSVHATTCTMVL